jgi:quercetin dioxygenase-like cupin family protein
MLVEVNHRRHAVSPVQSTGHIGSDIRALRRSRNWTLSDLAEQLEDIQNIAALFNLPVGFFFTAPANQDEQHHIVRAGSGRVMNDTSKGLREILLSPDLGGAFEIIHSVFAPGAKCPKPFVRPTEEAGYVISGQFSLFIDGQRFDLNPGDSFRFSGETITWVNEGDVDAVVVWVIAPPVY